MGMTRRVLTSSAGPVHRVRREGQACPSVALDFIRALEASAWASDDPWLVEELAAVLTLVSAVALRWSGPHVDLAAELAKIHHRLARVEAQTKDTAP